MVGIREEIHIDHPVIVGQKIQFALPYRLHIIIKQTDPAAGPGIFVDQEIAVDFSDDLEIKVPGIIIILFGINDFLGIGRLKKQAGEQYGQ